MNSTKSRVIGTMIRFKIFAPFSHLALMSIPIKIGPINLYEYVVPM